MEIPPETFADPIHPGTLAYFADLERYGQRDFARMVFTSLVGAAVARGIEALIHTGLGKLIALGMEAAPQIAKYQITDPNVQAVMQATLAAVTIGPLHWLAVTGVKPFVEAALGAQCKPILPNLAFPPGARRQRMQLMIDGTKPGQPFMDSTHYASFVGSASGRASFTTNRWLVATQSLVGGSLIGGLGPLAQLSSHLVEIAPAIDEQGRQVMVTHRFPTHAVARPWWKKPIEGEGNVSANPLTVGWKSIVSSFTEIREKNPDGTPGTLLRSGFDKGVHDILNRMTAVFQATLMSQLVVNNVFKEHKPDPDSLSDRMKSGPVVTAVYLLWLTAMLTMHVQRKPGKFGTGAVVDKLIHPVKSTEPALAMHGIRRPAGPSAHAWNGFIRLFALTHLLMSALITLPFHMVRDVPLAVRQTIRSARKINLRSGSERLVQNMLLPM